MFKLSEHGVQLNNLISQSCHHFFFFLLKQDMNDAHDHIDLALNMSLGFHVTNRFFHTDSSAATRVQRRLMIAL